MREKPTNPTIAWRLGGRIAGVQQASAGPGGPVGAWQGSVMPGTCLLCALPAWSPAGALPHWPCTPRLFPWTWPHLRLWAPGPSPAPRLQANEHAVVMGGGDGRLMVYDLRRPDTPLQFAVPDTK